MSTAPQRRTKIVCTLGPASDTPEKVRALMLAGMDVARFNFSHGTHEGHLELFNIVKSVREELDLPVAAMLDTKGPEVRVKTFRDGSAELVAGNLFTLTSREVEGSDKEVSISYGDLCRDVTKGSTILIDDGLIELRVEKTTDTDIVCRVINGGIVSNRKGVNVPNVDLSLPYLSDQDMKDVKFAVDNDFDFIAASFVRSAADVNEMRSLLRFYGCRSINIIAKIENRRGVENIDEIIAAADGIMVARGDMGVEIPFEEVPAIQKMIIHKVYNAGKQVITATQMLDSMIKNPRPTRAEATDVANAIYDGTSAIMLSGETANGAYPIEAVKTMDRIARCTEADVDYVKQFRSREAQKNPNITDAISHATCTTALDLRATAILSVSKTGGTVRMVSKYRPDCMIIGYATDEHVRRQLNMSWGVTPLLIKEAKSSDELFYEAVQAAIKKELLHKGDLVVITAGVPIGKPGMTNLLKVHVVE